MHEEPLAAALAPSMTRDTTDVQMARNGDPRGGGKTRIRDLVSSSNTTPWILFYTIEIAFRTFFALSLISVYVHSTRR